MCINSIYEYARLVLCYTSSQFVQRGEVNETKNKTRRIACPSTEGTPLSRVLRSRAANAAYWYNTYTLRLHLYVYILFFFPLPVHYFLCPSVPNSSFPTGPEPYPNSCSSVNRQLFCARRSKRENVHVAMAGNADSMIKGSSNDNNNRNNKWTKADIRRADGTNRTSPATQTLI